VRLEEPNTYEIGRYWVFDWLDRHNATSTLKLRYLLWKSPAFQELLDGANAVLKIHKLPVTESDSVLAGRVLDLSGELDCHHISCRKKRAGELIRHLGLYFEKIVLRDAVAEEISQHLNCGHLKDSLLDHLRILVYLRRIGAEPFLDFRAKPPGCQVHLHQHLKEAQLSRLSGLEDEITEMLLRDSTVSFWKNRDGALTYTVQYVELGHTQFGTLGSDVSRGLSERELKRRAVKDVLERFLVCLASDVRAASIYRLPLGTGIQLHQKLLQAATPHNVTDVMMRLKLPVLDEISPRMLVKIRNEERWRFERFRAQLRLAVQDQLKATDDPDPQKIADQIYRDRIEPEVAAIRERLRVARNALAKKGAVTVALGASVTTCGLLAGALWPISLLAGAAPTATLTGNAVGKYFDDVGGIGLKDLVFAWQTDHSH
jgi:hypothetical protein